METALVTTDPEDPGTLRLGGEIDMYTVPKLEVAFTQAISSGGRVTVDMANVTFIDSSGLHLLLRMASSMNGAKPLMLANIPPSVVRLMEIVGMKDHPDLSLQDEG